MGVPELSGQDGARPYMPERRKANGNVGLPRQDFVQPLARLQGEVPATGRAARCRLSPGTVASPQPTVPGGRLRRLWRHSGNRVDTAVNIGAMSDHSRRVYDSILE